ncbi:lipid droplet-associated hydrolase [Podospora australis]|uniref:Lipid droplet-associated hydrolase n=1 Tax=Podospora australis TaxID=1536484 RepID=A0AAN6WZK9_9PEZI|nr:lipid droplet-associated hydrolase [Podospora australis]
MTNTSALVIPDKIPFLSYPSPRSSNKSLKHVLIFFIPGNPGLISYYAPFLTALHQLLQEREKSPDCNYAYDIYGRNLIGFADEDHSPPFGSLTSPDHGATTTTRVILPFSLEQQIALLRSDLERLNRDCRVYDDVILIGHSVGSYIALELFHRHHVSSCTVPIKAAILLFPTVSHIARSPSGQKLNLLATYSWLDNYAHAVAKGFVSLLPASVLSFVVHKVMKFPPHAAEATLDFLRSKDGIWQALHMGKDEMRTITEEKWQKDFWEEITSTDTEGEGEREEEGKGKGNKFYFYFAEKDHWVADACRDEFIAARKQNPRARTEIVIGTEKIPHAFCIHHSETVAEKVKVWIDEITGQL